MSGGNANILSAQKSDRGEQSLSVTSSNQGRAKETDNEVAKGGSVSNMRGGMTVFIDAAPEDVKVASQMENALQEQHISYFPPVDSSSKFTQIIKDLEHKLRECDAVILINDRVPQPWFNERLRHYSRTFIQRNRPIGKVIVYRPNQDECSNENLVLPDKTKIEVCSLQKDCLDLLFAN